MMIIDFRNPAGFRFCVYELPGINKTQNLVRIRFIVLRNNLGLIVKFTGLEKYAGPYTGRNRIIEVQSKYELDYICKALNHIMFFQKTGIDQLSKITPEMVFRFFGAYINEPKSNGEYRCQQSIDKCIYSVSSFFANLVDASANPAMVIEDLMIESYQKINEKSRRVIKKYSPRYKGKTIEKAKKPLLRDIPEQAVKLIISEARLHDPMIAFPIVAQITAGPRPSEVLNLRRTNSPLGPGIVFEYIGSSVSRISLDLTHEYCLRSDGVSVGKIKKERYQVVYPRFEAEFYMAYQSHMQLISDIPCESEYRPMIMDRSGKAMTYDVYRKRFQNLIVNHVRPQLLKSPDPALQMFGQRLLTENLSPHSLRHYFTVRLCLCGEGIAQLQYYRGDASPESALWYLQNKGALIAAAAKYHEEAMNNSIMFFGGK